MPLSAAVKRLVTAAAAAMLLALSAAPAGASERRGFDPPRAGALDSAPVEEPFRDELLEDEARSSGKVSAAGSERTYVDRHGHTVDVEVSDRYAPDPAADQELVDFLGGLLHGGEMSRLSVMVLTPGELEDVCGPQALACYGPSAERMFISGEEGKDGQAPREFVIAHEYGHHLATNSDNSPWPAIDWGPKRWASYEGICPGVRTNRYFPGDEGRHYYSNPGEAFAEAFADYHYPGEVPWDWRQELKPDSAAFDAIVADVTDPWSGRMAIERDGRLSTSGARSDRVAIATPLDGRLTAKLSGPRHADFDLVLASARGKGLAESAGRGSDERIRYTLCGRRSVSLEVYRFKGAGDFQTRARRP